MDAHPDRNGGDASRFNALNAAWAASRATPPAQATNVPETIDFEGMLAAVQDLFGSGALGLPRGAGDVFAELRLSASEGLTECTRAVDFDRKEECDDCGYQPCDACRGRGVHDNKAGQFVIAGACGTCRGAGRIPEHPCGRCDHGWHNVRDTVSVTVPAGVRTGSQLVVPGKGRGIAERKGALVVTVIVDGGGALTRKGDDVTTERLVPLDTLERGGRLDLVDPHDVPLSIDVPRGTHDGTVLVVAGRGFAQSDGEPAAGGAAYRERGARGAMRVTVRLSSADRERQRARQRGRGVMFAGMLIAIFVVVMGMLSMAQR
jgi:DnaJ-class molecular chaperone